MQALLHGVVKLQSWHVADHMDPQCLISADAMTVLLQSKPEVYVFRSVEKKLRLSAAVKEWALSKK